MGRKSIQAHKSLRYNLICTYNVWGFFLNLLKEITFFKKILIWLIYVCVYIYVYTHNEPGEKYFSGANGSAITPHNPL